MKKIQTVLGELKTEDLDITLMHEHLFFDKSKFWEKPLKGEEAFAYSKMDIKMLGKLRQNPFLNLDNCLLNDEATSIKELEAYKLIGGSTLVDVTPANVGRNPRGLKRISEYTGINIIMGAGFYVHESHPGRIETFSVDQIKDEIVRDINFGVDNTGIKAGIIGEIGIGPNKTKREIKVLRAAARAQKITGVPLSIHMPGKNKYGNEVLDIIEEEGGDLNKTILCHTNHLIDEYEYQKSLFKRGVYLEYDMIGMDYSFPEGQGPSDTQNALGIFNLIKDGYISQLLISQDIFMKMMWKKYGGHGYSHILDNFVPRLKKLGITQKEIDEILIYNPKRVFE